MSNYLIKKFKGKYRIKTEYDLSTNQFPRELNGNFSTEDLYIDCYHNVRVFYYGKKTLEAYFPSHNRGRNVVNAIINDLGYDVIFDIKDYDKELLFRFKADDMEKLESYLKPKTSGATISPFSNKNLSKTDYTIPEEELSLYKNITANLDQKDVLKIAHMTKNFISTLATRKLSIEDIKADMAKRGLKGKEYIHAIGKWKNYISYLEKNIDTI